MHRTATNIGGSWGPVSRDADIGAVQAGARLWADSLVDSVEEWTAVRDSDRAERIARALADTLTTHGLPGNDFTVLNSTVMDRADLRTFDQKDWLPIAGFYSARVLPVHLELARKKKLPLCAFVRIGGTGSSKGESLFQLWEWRPIEADGRCRQLPITHPKPHPPSPATLGLHFLDDGAPQRPLGSGKAGKDRSGQDSALGDVEAPTRGSHPAFNEGAGVAGGSTEGNQACDSAQHPGTAAANGDEHRRLLEWVLLKSILDQRASNQNLDVQQVLLFAGLVVAGAGLVLIGTGLFSVGDGLQSLGRILNDLPQKISDFFAWKLS